MVIREKPYKQEAFVMETMHVKMEFMVQTCFNNCSKLCQDNLFEQIIASERSGNPEMLFYLVFDFSSQKSAKMTIYSFISGLSGSNKLGK